MYLQHFALKRKPFEQLPDADFLFLSDQHEAALNSIGFAVAIQDSFVVVTGEIGSGKTTLLHMFLQEHLKGAAVAYVTQTRLSDTELLQSILVEFGESPFDMGKVQLLTLLKSTIKRLQSDGKQVVIVVDEAQNLSTDVLEELRLVTCSSPGSRQLINVVLVGQPQFNAKLDSPDLVQLRQRCRLRYHLGALAEEEAVAYIRHRLSVAGGDINTLFEPAAIGRIVAATRGIPRLINMLCDTALIFSHVDGAKTVTEQVVAESIAKLDLGAVDPASPASADDRGPTTNQADSVGQPASSEHSAVLRSIDERLPGVEQRLSSSPSLIGRAPDCNFHVPQRALSRYHAVIKFNGPCWTVSDLRSTNGTFVNGRRVSAASLSDGDTLRFADLSFKFFENPRRDERTGDDEDTGSFPRRLNR